MPPSPFWSAVLLWAVLAASPALGQYDIQQIADENLINREPVISESGAVAWHAFQTEEDNMAKDIYFYTDGETRNVTRGRLEARSANFRARIQSNRLVWTSTITNFTAPSAMTWQLAEVPNRDDLKPGLELDADYKVIKGGSKSQEPELQQFAKPSDLMTNGQEETEGAARPIGRHPSGNNEIFMWSLEDGEVIRLTRDFRNDLAPGFYGDLFAWQKAKGWPFGWEIMVLYKDNRYQLTTNFYYDMAPQVHGSKLAYYGWDGNDFEVFLHDAEAGGLTQITSNQYDDVSPIIYGDIVAWEAYPQVEGDIFVWSDGRIRKVSDNIEDDLNPRIWESSVVWQGFDGDDFEIYLFNGTNTLKLTSNLYDDVNPEIRDGTVTWMGYHDNWDPEIFVWDGEEITRLTDNELEDQNPRTAGGKVVWQTDDDDKSYIYLATPSN